MEKEQRLTWQEIVDTIKCPFSSLRCRRNEGVVTGEKRIEHDTALYVAQCNFCGKKAMEWGYDQFTSANDLSIQSKTHDINKQK